MAERTKKEKAEYKRRLERKFKKASKGRKPQKLSKAAMDAYKKMGVKPKDFSKVKPNQEMMGKFKKYSRPKAKTATAVANHLEFKGEMRESKSGKSWRCYKNQINNTFDLSAITV